MISFLLAISIIGTKFVAAPTPTTDTLIYDGSIAVEIANTMKYEDGRLEDPISIWNTNNCFGFVLFDDGIGKINYEQAFFPLLFCDKEIDIYNSADTNNFFLDKVLNDSTQGKLPTTYEAINIKNIGKLHLNYRVLKVKLKYLTVGKAMIKKYVKSKTNSTGQVKIAVNICRIVELKQYEEYTQIY